MEHEELLKHIQQAVDTCFEYGLVPYKDGNQWCVLYGENIQDGIVGFGDTRLDAMLEFKKEYDSYVKRTHLYPAKKQPVTDCHDFEEEIENYFGNIPDDTDKIDIARHFAEWQRKQDQSLIELAEDHAMLAGMNKMMEEMMEKAVEAEVNTYEDLAAGKSWAEFVVEMPTKNIGDKVKVIVIPE